MPKISILIFILNIYIGTSLAVSGLTVMQAGNALTPALAATGVSDNILESLLLISSLLLLSETFNGISNTYNYGGEIDIITIVQLGLILIFIGFLFKIAAAPFHN